MYNSFFSQLPKIYQAFLMSATLSEDVKALKKMVLHNAVSLLCFVVWYHIASYINKIMRNWWDNVIWYCKTWLCRLRRKAAHRDHFVWPLSVCLSRSHTFLVVTYSYVLLATNAFLGMLPFWLINPFYYYPHVTIIGEEFIFACVQKIGSLQKWKKVVLYIMDIYCCDLKSCSVYILSKLTINTPITHSRLQPISYCVPKLIWTS